MSGPISLETKDSPEFNFFPNASGLVEFKVKAPKDAHVALSTVAAEEETMYEIIIGGWNNSKSVIRKNKISVTAAATPGILNETESRGFWIRWNNGIITVGRQNETVPFLSWTDSEIIGIKYVGFFTAKGATGSWIIERPREQAAISTEAWVPARDGELPSRAFAGGTDNGEAVYVIRANFKGGLIPGKLIPSQKTSYIPWGSAEHALKEYEVLTDFKGWWVSTSGGKIPPNVFTAGESEDGEPLYIGRVLHDGVLSVGKVHHSKATCYIPYGGKELSFKEYEILVK